MTCVLGFILFTIDKLMALSVEYIYIHIHQQNAMYKHIYSLWRARAYSVACGFCRLLTDFYDETGGQWTQ